jgi:hypothetical protein
MSVGFGRGPGAGCQSAVEEGPGKDVSQLLKKAGDRVSDSCGRGPGAGVVEEGRGRMSVSCGRGLGTGCQTAVKKGWDWMSDSCRRGLGTGCQSAVEEGGGQEARHPAVHLGPDVSPAFVSINHQHLPNIMRLQ